MVGTRDIVVWVSSHAAYKWTSMPPLTKPARVALGLDDNIYSEVRKAMSLGLKGWDAMSHWLTLSELDA